MPTPFRFEPTSFSWVALHPNPRGVIQFIGGAGFGSFPTVCYRYFLRQLFEAGYTIVAIPFRFSFRHWAIALNLLEEQQILRKYLAESAQRAGYDAEFYYEASNYYWIGHSLGCKYIELLEVLSDSEWAETVETCIDSATAEWIAERLPTACAIRGQRSLLLAPDISDTESAIPVKALARALERLGWGVRPGRQQTQCLVSRSQLFHLTAMISFAQDTVAGSIEDSSVTDSDVRWFLETLRSQGLIYRELSGKHLEPVGIRVGRYIVDLNPLDKFIQPLSQRTLETVVVELLQKLAYR